MLYQLKLITFFTSLFCFINIYGQQKSIEITSKRNDDNSVTLNFKKMNPGSTYVIISFKRLANTNSRSVVQRTIKGRSGNVLTLKPINDKNGIEYSYSYTYMDGDHKPKPDENFKYVLPFKNKEKVEVRNLSYLGKRFGNTEPKNWKAFQFLVTSGDTIYASRKGIVVKIENDLNSDNTQEYSFKSKANYIIVEHKDGTLARYGVLKKNSIMVKLGDKVYPSMPIAIAGSYDKPENSQLRFTVYYLDKGNLESYDRSKENLSNQRHFYAHIDPFFYVNDGQIIKLTAGNTYSTILNKEIIELEMTKREKKKLAKFN
ncbi:M23 family metallopeptidase [Flavobacteriaceae bacterium AU392]|nr:M23 family peptidase [Flavobacteriaceae bacterium]RKM81597.1 M23 family metallopeptidase [Flavobacteriaceae bacterium AU392]